MLKHPKMFSQEIQRDGENIHVLVCKPCGAEAEVIMQNPRQLRQEEEKFHKKHRTCKYTRPRPEKKAKKQEE